MTAMASSTMATGRLSAALGASSTMPCTTGVRRALHGLLPRAVRCLRLRCCGQGRSGTGPDQARLSSAWESITVPLRIRTGKTRAIPGRRSENVAGVRAMGLSSRTEVVVDDDAFADYKCSTAFLFPGQGAQSVGMGSTVGATPEAVALFEKANEILGYNLLDICLEGPEDKLNSTVISQPAIYVASLAAVEALRTSDEGQAILNSCDVACGLSLGEYTALSFAGALSLCLSGGLAARLRVTWSAGLGRSAAADAAPTAMVSVIGLDKEKVRELCEVATGEAGNDNTVQIANFLCPGNYAVSGSSKACEIIEKKAKEFGARMTVRLAVAGAFHTHYMAPAVEKLTEALSSTTITAPRIPVISNVDAKPHSDPDVIRKILAQQVTSPVQWETTLKTLLERGMAQSYELGPGKVIAGILKRIDRKIPVTNVSV
ncbi:hypothetical protein CBR_g33923 [Chara braunii]|uniref:Malonyl-CoA:ACP transacylase (MAT) domain-containing protein n=1 Tax=Chara braunii TaxID=69332 RepID=A0A388LHM3_CHABU|nr:hypothetical protein CBR_g33923 [Chara braunii]|eukprot:GBG81745.1 hypothetical protein CBR_g33923 [Chara braunii]